VIQCGACSASTVPRTLYPMRHLILLTGLALAIPGCMGELDAGPVNGAVESGASRFPRLTHDQWRNATRDLLYLDERPAYPLNEAASSGTFASGAELGVGGTLWAQYQSAAEALANDVTGDADALNRILPDGLPTEPIARSRGFVEGFGLRVFRRPLSEDEATAYTAQFAEGASLYPDLDPFAAGVRHVLAAMLQSPNFLYRVERSTERDVDQPSAIPLDGWEIASRLSFALWNSIPDDELFRAAEAGELATEAGVREQATRMVNEPAADEMLRDFHERLLGVSGYLQITRSTTVFPEYSDALRDISMPGEVRHFLDDVMIEHDGGFRDLMTSRVTYVDGRLAPLYDIAGVSGEDFVRVELDPAERAGVLTMVGFLSANATSTETDPIHRGVFVARRILCEPLPAPPNNVPPLPPPSDMPRTMRDRVDEHTGRGTCGSSCHGGIINPLGFAFERFDALGRVQVLERTTMLPLDTSSVFAFDDSVQPFGGAVELAEIVAESRDAHRCYADHLAEYLFGERSVRRSVATRGGNASLDDDASVREVAVEIVTHDLFRSRPAAAYTGPAGSEEN